MKTNSASPALKNLFFVAFTASLILFLTSCARKIRFGVSSVVPAAEGHIKVSKDKNGNYNIDLNIIRLADPGRLNPAKKMYIVWMETDGNGTRNIGQLKTSSKLLSKTLKSSLKTVSAFKPTKIYITAEDIASLQYPAGQTVLSTDNF